MPFNKHTTCPAHVASDAVTVKAGKRVVLDQKNYQHRAIILRGILTQWDVSNQFRPGENEDESALQPVRIGTWQFTSAYRLDHPAEAVCIADDMEAFFHLSLYMGLRYLRNNCQNLQMTMFDYFDGYKYDVTKQHYVCGSDKRGAMRDGRLVDVADQRYRFLGDNRDGEPRNHPIDQIFRTCVRWFSGRYKLKELQAWERERGEDESPSEDELGPDPKLLDSKLDDPPPSQRATVWPEMDKVGDQLRPAPVKKKRGRKGGRGTHLGKRVKADPSAKHDA
ncbi:hypothetical protein OH76DRAFT_257635 [Lentinus brumalis]|uniref:Fungal-type protein kinase domain-containing protein n=1 Tax=Lentinus brumalis TaxID=2498619 RepID=A0A371CL65_9APHY|nr:hypothetical protein OH76DRAFT_257635 [Polyporus brumalis]